MLDTPLPEHRFRTDPSTWIKDAHGRRLRTVDLHAHLITLAVERLVAECPQKKSEPEIRTRTMGSASVDHNNRIMLPGCAAALTELSVRLEDMDRMGVDMQVVSVNVLASWTDREHQRTYQNVAQLVMRYRVRQEWREWTFDRQVHLIPAAGSWRTLVYPMSNQLVTS